MKTIVSTLIALGLAACFTTPAAAQNVGGRYQVIGKNFNGSPYSGTAEIVVTSPTTCRIAWVTGGTTSRGICMRNGIAFSAGYVLNGKVGLVIYELKNDGTLDGLWTIADQEGVGGERLVPIR
jgi:hypothetical protein